jgi:hypothetical protein
VPSGAPERAVFIREADAGGFEVVSVQLKENLWGQIMARCCPPGNPSRRSTARTIAGALAKLAPKPERRTAALDAATARALSDTWNAADRRRSLPARRKQARTAITYYFADATEQFRAGEVWTPADNTRMAALVSLARRCSRIGWQEAGRTRRRRSCWPTRESLKAKLRAAP